MMNNVEQAREMFKKLEECSVGNATNIAKRMFFIQDRLSCVKY